MNILSRAATATVKSKARLWLEYFLIFLILVLAAFSVWFYMRSLQSRVAISALQTEVKSAQQRVELVEGINNEQAIAIKTMGEVAKINDVMLQGLAADLGTLAKRDAGLTQRLSTLEKTNEAVRIYLRTAVPAPVGCVLDQTCDTDEHGVSGTERGTTATVPAASDETDEDQQ